VQLLYREAKRTQLHIRRCAQLNRTLHCPASPCNVAHGNNRLRHCIHRRPSQAQAVNTSRVDGAPTSSTPSHLPRDSSDATVRSARSHSPPRSVVCSSADTNTHTRYDRRVVFGALLAGLGLRPPSQECELLHLHRIARYRRLHFAACPLPPSTDQMKPQQQLSQIEKSVTHLLVATKQLLGSSHAPSHPAPCPTDLTLHRNTDVMVARHRHRKRGLRRLRAPWL